jgi:hypothetical protein
MLGWYGEPLTAPVGHPFFVGADLPTEIAHAVHAPNADLREIAHRILALIGYFCSA